MTREPTPIVGKVSDPGPERLSNEDALDSYEPVDPTDLATLGRLYVVAGNMSATPVEGASQLAVQRIIKEYVNDDTSPDVASRLRQAFEKANADLHRLASGQNTVSVSVIAAVLLHDTLTIAHLGNCRAYLVHGETGEQLTEDFPIGLGQSSTVVPVIAERTVHTGDAILLCSDGVYEKIPTEDLAFLMVNEPPEDAAEQMIQLARTRRAADDASALIFTVPAMLAAAVPARPPRVEVPARPAEVIPPPRREEVPMPPKPPVEAPIPPRREEVPIPPYLMAEEPSPDTSRATSADIPTRPAPSRSKYARRPSDMKTSSRSVGGGGLITNLIIWFSRFGLGRVLKIALAALGLIIVVLVGKFVINMLPSGPAATPAPTPTATVKAVTSPVATPKGTVIAAPTATPTPRPRTAEQVRTEFNQAWSQGNWEVVLSRLAELRQLDPQFDAGNVLAPLITELKADLMKPATDPARRNATYYVNGVRAYLLYNWPEAISNFQALYEANPRYRDVADKLFASYFNYSCVLRAQGNTTAANDQFKLAQKLDPKRAEAVRNQCK